MSRPKYYWYTHVRNMIMNVEKVRSDETLQATIFLHAIADADAETSKLPNGAERLRAVKEILIDKSHTYVGVAQELFYDERTIQRWVNSYIKLVGRKAGF